MEENIARPILVYDGDCGFCRFWIAKWKALTGDKVQYNSYQESASRFPNITLEEFKASIFLIKPQGDSFRGAEAVFRALAEASHTFWLRMYQHVFGFKAVTEWGYRLIARHRPFFSRLTYWLYGSSPEPSTYQLSQWLFMRCLAIVYFIAFFSLGIQIKGLIGENGILPVETYFKAAYSYFGAKVYTVLPSIFFLKSSDAFLQSMCFLGAALSFILFFGILRRIILIVLYVLYLSYLYAGQDFMSFQWDILILETGFLAVFLGRSKWMQTLFRWLLFRFMFLSGIVKILSGDETWRNLTALQYHYETQPLPTFIAWYAHQLPLWFQKISVAGMFFIEIIVPYFIFFPRRIQHLVFFFLAGFQILIFLTGNYNFFNILTLSLCLFLLDDAFLKKFFPSWILTRILKPVKPLRFIILRKGIIFILSAVILTSGVSQLVDKLWHCSPRIIRRFTEQIAPFAIVNTYGLFAVMTTSRYEIVVEGSDDGTNWKAYEFKYKPGNLVRSPVWATPHQPRLDWQMWFAALGNYKRNPWFVNFCVRLLENSPEVLKLLENNPFPDRAPLYIRASLYDYRFTNMKEKRENGNWWKRERVGLYLDPISLKRDQNENDYSYSLLNV